LCRVIPQLAARAYTTGGVTVPEAERERLRTDPALVYPNAVSDFAKRHWVFRRTNLPCLECGTHVRQKRQVTHTRDDGEEKERIIYFCPRCQNTAIDLAPRPGRNQSVGRPFRGRV
jgi:formamidopyrimidine-DNA glycosylase